MADEYRKHMEHPGDLTRQFKNIGADGNGNTVYAPVIGLASPTTVYSGGTTVANAGTSTGLAAAQAVLSVTVKARSTNTGIIYVGGAAVAAGNGFQLAAGDTVSLDISDLSAVHLDASVSGDGATYIAVG